MEKKRKNLDLPLQMCSPTRHINTSLNSFRTQCLKLKTKRLPSQSKELTMNLSTLSILKRYKKQLKAKDPQSPLNTTRIKKILSKEKKPQVAITSAMNSTKTRNKKKPIVKSIPTNKTGSSLKQTTKDQESKRSEKSTLQRCVSQKQPINLFRVSSVKRLQERPKRDCFKHFYGIKRVVSQEKIEHKLTLTSKPKKHRVTSLEKVKEIIRNNKDKILRVMAKHS